MHTHTTTSDTNRRMPTDDEGNETETFTGRIPTQMAAMGSDGVRDLLERWVASGAKVEDPGDLETKLVGWNIPTEVMDALRKEAERLAKLHPKAKITPAKVAGIVWQQWK